jgi:hypothetical protein
MRSRVGLAVGELQHHHQHPVQPLQQRGHQAERHHHPNLLVEASINYDGNVINITNSANCRSAVRLGVVRIASSATLLTRELAGRHRLRALTTPAEDMGSAPWHNAAEDYEPKVDVSTPWASTP